jgi:uncharacterized membrane protein
MKIPKGNENRRTYIKMIKLGVVVCPFVLFLLDIVLSVFIWFMVTDYHFGMFTLFFLVYSSSN